MDGEREGTLHKRGPTTHRLMDRARKMVRESSPSVLAANLLAKMNTAEAESMAQRRRSCINQSINPTNNQSIKQRKKHVNQARSGSPGREQPLPHGEKCAMQWIIGSPQSRS